MKRAITELEQLPDSRQFEEISIGVEKIVEGMRRLDAAARSLSIAGNEYPARILGNLAEEEASKVLILADLVRCPAGRHAERSRLLRYFYKHLPKGIYVEACKWTGILTFDEMKRAIDSERISSYLDGPNDVDWIFPNQILQRREDDLYVNYVRDDGSDDVRYWTSPLKDALTSLFPYHRSESIIIRIADALCRLGATSPNGLEVMAEIWRPIKIVPELEIEELRKLNRSTLDALDAHGVLRKCADDAGQIIIQRWPFPLYPLDLNLQEIDKKDLRDRQQSWGQY